MEDKLATTAFVEIRDNNNNSDSGGPEGTIMITTRARHFGITQAASALAMPIATQLTVWEEGEAVIQAEVAHRFVVVEVQEAVAAVAEGTSDENAKYNLQREVFDRSNGCSRRINAD